MQEVLDLIHSNRMLSKQAICSIKNQQHVRQAVGLYRLLVAARDFDTFKRLVVYARQNVNNEMFVHVLVLSLGERQDTQMLIVPALHEILPQLFIKDRVIDQVRQLDTGVSSIRPQLTDVMGVGRRHMLFNPRFGDEQQGGLLDVLNRSQLWMPWRELHKQLAVRKMIGGNVLQQDETQLDKVVISLPGSGLLSQDIGLKSYVGILIDEILINQDTIKNSNKNYAGIGGLDSNIMENILLGRGAQGSGANIMGGIRKNRIDNDLYMNSLYGNNLGGRQFNAVQEDINSDRLLHVGRRSRNNVFGVNGELEQNIYGGNRGIGGVRNLDIELGTDNVMDRNYATIGGKRFGNINDDNNLFLGGSHIKNRMILDDGTEVDRNLYIGTQNLREGQSGVNTVSVNDPRLLFVGRRRKNPNNVESIGNSLYKTVNSRYQVGTNQYDEDDYISGGRHVSNDRDNNESQRSKYNRNGDYITLEDNLNNDRYIKNNRRSQIMDIDSEQDDLYLNTNRGINSKGYYQNYQDNDYNNRNSYGYGLGQKGIGRNNDDFLNIITRGRIGQKQYFDKDQDLIYNHGYVGQNSGESLDMYLPTTDINDERLLHINRHKLNNVVEGRRVNSMTGVVDDDNENFNDRYNTEYQGYQRGNVNKQRSYVDEQNYLDMIQRGNQNVYGGERVNNRDDKRGHRYRRSVVNKELGQTSTINGKLVLHSLQQLVARLNIERIALGQPLLIDNTQKNIGYGILANNLLGVNGIGNVDGQTIAVIENIIQHLNQVLQQCVDQITIPSYNQKINEIGLILAGQIQDLGLTNILGDILQQTNQQERKGLVVNLLENEAAQILLAGIVQVVDQKLQQIYLQREEFISTVRGITINNVGVDKLQTFLEQTDIDLTNLLNNNNIEQAVQGNGKVVVGRVPRLNHKSFNIEIDVTSDRQQQVVIRNLLVPKVDGQNNIIPLVERRQNVVVLDVTTAELQQGRNSLKLNSRDITITSPDTTPLTKIYQLVMKALNGDIMLQQDLLTGQSSLLPHRLLLPRGRATGLPMQLITVITPLTGSSGIMGIQKGAELNTLFLDNLPLNYPLHCDITNLDDVVSMPNLLIKDVKIYHEDNIKTPLINTY